MQVAHDYEHQDGENQDGEGELSDDEIDRLLESANEEVDYLSQRRAERAHHFKQQNSNYARTEQASRQLSPIAKQVGKALSFKL